MGIDCGTRTARTHWDALASRALRRPRSGAPLVAPSLRSYAPRTPFWDFSIFARKKGPKAVLYRTTSGPAARFRACLLAGQGSGGCDVGSIFGRHHRPDIARRHVRALVPRRLHRLGQGHTSPGGGCA